MEVNDEKVTNWVEVKKILLKKEKENELGYEQKNALDHLRKFCKISEAKANKIISELRQIEKLKDKHIANIVNFLPENQEELRILFANERVVLTNEDKKKILKIVKDNR